MEISGVARRLLVATILILWSVSSVDGAELAVEIKTAAVMTNPEGGSIARILYKFDWPAELSGARIDRALLVFPLGGDTLRDEQILRVSPAGVCGQPAARCPMPTWAAWTQSQRSSSFLGRRGTRP